MFYYIRTRYCFQTRMITGARREVLLSFVFDARESRGRRAGGGAYSFVACLESYGPFPTPSLPLSLYLSLLPDPFFFERFIPPSSVAAPDGGTGHRIVLL